MRSLQSTPSPGKEAEESTGAKRSPREPDECRISLRLSTSANLVYAVGCSVILASHTSIDDIIMREVLAISMRLIAGAVERYKCRKRLNKHPSY